MRDKIVPRLSQNRHASSSGPFPNWPCAGENVAKFLDKIRQKTAIFRQTNSSCRTIQIVIGVKIEKNSHYLKAPDTGCVHLAGTTRPRHSTTDRSGGQGPSAAQKTALIERDRFARRQPIDRVAPRRPRRPTERNIGCSGWRSGRNGAKSTVDTDGRGRRPTRIATCRSPQPRRARRRQ